MRVRLKPRSQRAKNRVREHGAEMTLVREKKSVQCFGGKAATFFRADDGWSGWFRRPEDVEVETLTEE